MDLATIGWGDGDRTALLVHGIGSNKEGWWRVGPALADLGYTVTGIDLRGHGESPKADRYLLADFAGDLFGLEGAPWDLLVGHSLGGAIAAKVMSESPGFAQRLILEDPALFLPDPAVTLPMLVAEFDQPLTFEAQHESNPSWHPEDTRIKTEALKQCGREVVERIVLDNGSWNLVEATVGITRPILVLGAGIDPITPPEVGEGLAALSDRITFVQIPGSSHSIHRDEFDPMMSAVEAWLASTTE